MSTQKRASYSQEKGLLKSVILQPSGAELEITKLHPLGAEIKTAVLPTLLADIGWKKNVAIMEKCKDLFER